MEIFREQKNKNNNSTNTTNTTNTTDTTEKRIFLRSTKRERDYYNSLKSINEENKFFDNFTNKDVLWAYGVETGLYILFGIILHNCQGFINCIKDNTNAYYLRNTDKKYSFNYNINNYSMDTIFNDENMYYDWPVIDGFPSKIFELDTSTKTTKIDNYFINFFYEYFLYYIIRLININSSIIDYKQIPKIFFPSFQWLFLDTARSDEIVLRWTKESKNLHKIISYLDSVSNYDLYRFYNDLLIEIFLNLVNIDILDDTSLHAYISIINEEILHIEGINSDYKGFIIPTYDKILLYMQDVKERAETLKENSKREKNKKNENFKDKLDESINELNKMIGLQSVKNDVNSLINLLNVNRKRLELGMEQLETSKHLVFTGNPGTGKTTVARLLGKIYYYMDVIEKPDVVEVDRSKLVAKYVGQTAAQTQEIINSALGGILFIDEAYTLTPKQGDGGKDFGYEAVDTILKAMEDNRDNLIVIVAGYTDLMKDFINANPGLKSRFNKYIQFDDYNPTELFDIFKFNCEKKGYILENAAAEYCSNYFIKLYENRGKNFANARDVRNYFEKTVTKQSNRIVNILDKNPMKEEMQKIILEDVIV